MDNIYDLPKLTPQQQNAVLYYCTCCAGNKSAAYRRAYDCTNSKEETIWKEASKLFSNPKVIPWIKHYEDKLNQHIENEIKYTRSDFFDELERIRAKTEDSNKTIGIALKAVELKAKASGLLKEVTDNTTKVVVNMGTVQKDGKPIEFNVGEKLDTTSSDT